MQIGRLEVQQQQQQLLNIENIDTSSFRNASTKLINLLMAAVAVFFVIMSLAINIVNPFVHSRYACHTFGA